MLYARENKAILMLLCDGTYNLIQNHINYYKDLHQIFSCLFETFGSMPEINFIAIACHGNNFSKAENT